LDIRATLEDKNIYLVLVGEAENFCKEISGHGPKFVSTLLETMSLDDRKLKPLTEFALKAHGHELKR
jgi:hypothetical protein